MLQLNQQSRTPGWRVIVMILFLPVSLLIIHVQQTFDKMYSCVKRRIACKVIRMSVIAKTSSTSSNIDKGKAEHLLS